MPRSLKLVLVLSVLAIVALLVWRKCQVKPRCADFLDSEPLFV
jgi:hypothetical protein